MNKSDQKVLAFFSILIGCVIGFFGGVIAPFIIAQVAMATGTDPTAAGGAWVLIFYTVPGGVVLGGACGYGLAQIPKRETKHHNTEPERFNKPPSSSPNKRSKSQSDIYS